MDRDALQPIHWALAAKDLLPGKHLVDAGYVDADQLVISARDYCVDLIGPTPKDDQWQARTKGAFAEEARRINGEIIPSPWKDRQILVTRGPVGVVGAISPWNFPFSMLSRKAAPALAPCYTIVIKPSEFTPYCGLLYAVLAEKAGVPAGVVNVVTGEGAAVGVKLCANPLVRKITFTGSTRVGELLYSKSAGTMKKLSMELGGNAPTIVSDDADLDLAVEVAVAVAGKFRNSGQTCICANPFYVQDGIYDEFARRLTDTEVTDLNDAASLLLAPQ